VQREAQGKLQRCEELLATTRTRAEAAESATAVAEARGAEKARQLERLTSEAGAAAVAKDKCAELEIEVGRLVEVARAASEAENNATAAVMAMAARAEGNASEVAGLAFSLEMVAGKARKALRAVAKDMPSSANSNGENEGDGGETMSAAAAAARAALEHLKSASQLQRQQQEQRESGDVGGVSGVGGPSVAAAAAGLATEAVAALADVSLRLRSELVEASTALEVRMQEGGQLHAVALAAEQAVETGQASAKLHEEAKDKEVREFGSNNLLLCISSFLFH